MAIDFSFIRELEGFETEGYVPQDDKGILGESGVTVGSGIDLGQWTRRQLESAGVDKAILDKIEPYLGKKKQKAVDLLNQQPLQLSEQEAEGLTSAVKSKYANDVKRWYNKNNQAGNDWSDLTDKQQTVVTSVAFQYGVGSTKTPKFNEQVLKNNWEGLATELQSFGDQFKERRNKELQYLTGSGANAPQRASQTPSRSVPAPDQDESVDPLVRALADRIKSGRGVKQTKPKPKTEEKAVPTTSPVDSLIQSLSKSEAVRSRVYDRSVLNPTTSEPEEGKSGGRDEIKDPILRNF